MKKLKTIKYGSFNTMTSREKEIIARKVKITMGCTWKTIWKGEKTTGEQGWIPFALSSFVLCKNGGLPYTVMIFSLRRDLFSTSLPYKLSTIFFIVLSLVLTLIVQQHVPLIIRGILLGTGQVSHYDSPIWTLIQLIYYVVAGGERMITSRLV